MSLPRLPAAVAHSLVASAQRITSRTMPGKTPKGGSGANGWQEDSWEMYDLVGEQRFLANTLANRMSQARFYVGTLPEDPTERPVPVDDERLTSILNALGSSPSGFAQLVQRMGTNLFVAGECWLAGIPNEMMPLSQGGEGLTQSQFSPAATQSIETLAWRLLSTAEVATATSGEVVLHLGPDKADKVSCQPDDVFLIRIYRSHPRFAWQADSPTRASLPVLRELVGLTMHISAQVDSRLAGAGVYIVPQSAQRALNVAAGLDADSPGDLFSEALIEAMLTPVQDRSNASALVPLVVTVPDEAHDKFHHDTFSTPLDEEARELRDEAIRRLALGQDAPPELLLGTSGMNHWGAWLVREDVVNTHIEPPVALFCDALTTQYLWPVLLEQGMTQEQARQYVIWYDVSHMITRPNRSSDALDLHSRGVISSEALRAATGFGEADALVSSEGGEVPASVLLTLELALRNPAIFGPAGLAGVEQQIRDLLEGRAPAPAEDVPPAEPTPPDDDSSGDSSDDSGDGALPSGDSADDDVPIGNGPPEA